MKPDQLLPRSQVDYVWVGYPSPLQPSQSPQADASEVVSGVPKAVLSKRTVAGTTRRELMERLL
jgi:hypothetical protein